MPWLITILMLLWSGSVAAQCLAGPDEVSAEALHEAFTAQTAISDHLGVAVEDHESREISDALYRSDDSPRHGVTAQASLSFSERRLPGFSVCDAAGWEDAKLSGYQLGFAAGLGVRGIARLELRGFGVGDSIIQDNLGQYYPDRAAGAQVVVPGATGAGHGLWSMRLSVADWVAVTIGRTSSHSIEHRVGWSEDTDEDGNVDIVKNHTYRWGPSHDPRTFVALGIPRLGTSDLVFGDGHVERFGLATGWFVNRFVALRADGAYDGLLGGALVGAEVVPLAGIFAQPQLPTFRARLAGEVTSAALAEASVGAQLGYAFSKADLPIPGDLATIDIETGIYGVGDLQRVAPGIMATVDAALPIYAIIRVSAWAGVNRPETIRAVPNAVGRAELGASLYLSYSH